MGAVVSLIIGFLILLLLSHLFILRTSTFKDEEGYKMTKKKNILKAIGIYSFIAMMLCHHFISTTVDIWHFP